MGTDSGCAMRQRIFMLCSVKANPCEAFEALHGPKILEGQTAGSRVCFQTFNGSVSFLASFK